MFVDIIKVFIF